MASVDKIPLGSGPDSFLDLVVEGRGFIDILQQVTSLYGLVPLELEILGKWNGRSCRVKRSNRTE